jgi:hypothetical protein
MYTAYSASVTLLRLRYLRRHRKDEDGRLRQESFVRLNYRLHNVRQMITAMFYLFGPAFFTEIQNA